MNLFRRLWRDEAGYVLSAELALLGTVGVVGATVGLGAVSKPLNDELTEMAYAFRSLDQSYCFEGQTGCGAWTAGSHFVQQDVEASRAELGKWIEEQRESVIVQPNRDTNENQGAGARERLEDRRRESERRRRERQERMRRQQDRPDGLKRETEQGAESHEPTPRNRLPEGQAG